MQGANNPLMLHVGGWRHVVLPVDQLVPLPVVGKLHEVVVGELHARLPAGDVPPGHSAHSTVVCEDEAEAGSTTVAGIQRDVFGNVAGFAT
jgi:hypothetical protein